MMQAVPRHPLIDDYLRRLEDAAQALGPARRGELVDDIREHLREALPGAHPDTGPDTGPDTRPDTDEVRRVLDRLGDPHDLVAAAWGDTPVEPGPVAPGPGAASVAPPGPARGYEPWRQRSAIALLLAAELIAPIWPVSVPAWFAGLVLFGTVAGWNARERRLGWVFLGGGWPMGILFTIAGLLPFVLTTQECIGAVDGTVTCTGSQVHPGAAAAVLAVFACFALAQVMTVLQLVRARVRVDG